MTTLTSYYYAYPNQPYLVQISDQLPRAGAGAWVCVPTSRYEPAHVVGHVWRQAGPLRMDGYRQDDLEHTGSGVVPARAGGGRGRGQGGGLVGSWLVGSSWVGGGWFGHLSAGGSLVGYLYPGQACTLASQQPGPLASHAPAP